MCPHITRHWPLLSPGGSEAVPCDKGQCLLWGGFWSPDCCSWTVGISCQASLVGLLADAKERIESLFFVSTSQDDNISARRAAVRVGRIKR